MSLLAAQSLFVLGALCILLVVTAVLVITLVYFYYKYCVNAKRSANFDLETEDGLVIHIQQSNEYIL